MVTATPAEGRSPGLDAALRFAGLWLCMQGIAFGGIWCLVSAPAVIALALAAIALVTAALARSLSPRVRRSAATAGGLLAAVPFVVFVVSQDAGESIPLLGALAVVPPFLVAISVLAVFPSPNYGVPFRARVFATAATSGGALLVFLVLLSGGGDLDGKEILAKALLTSSITATLQLPLAIWTIAAEVARTRL